MNDPATAPASAQHPFNPRLVAGMIAAGIVTFAALMLLIAYGGGVGSGRDGRAHALSVSAVGFAGLVDLAGRFRTVQLVREDADLEGNNLLVVALEERSRPESVRQLLARREDRPTLIILPKWTTLPDPARPDWVRGVTPGAGDSAENLLPGAPDVMVTLERSQPTYVPGEGLLAGMSVPVARSPQTIEGDNVRPLASLPGGGKQGRGSLIAQLGDQPHYVVADPDLLNNHGLRNPEVARAALALIDRLNWGEANGVDFDLTVNGLGAAGSMSMLRLAFEPPFLAMTLALVAAALLAGLHGAFRFGPVRRTERAIAFGKAALVENSAGLVRMAERETKLGGAYADVVRHEVARAVHAPPSLDAGDLDRRLDRLGPRGEPGFSELAAHLAVARDRTRLMTAARALFRWKKAIIR